MFRTLLKVNLKIFKLKSTFPQKRRCHTHRFCKKINSPELNISFRSWGILFGRKFAIVHRKQALNDIALKRRLHDNFYISEVQFLTLSLAVN